MKKRVLALIAVTALAAGVLTGCGSSTTGQGKNTDGANGKIPQIEGLTYEKSVDFTYAECLAIYRYEGGYSLVDIFDDARYLIVPEGGSVPENLEEDITVIRQPQPAGSKSEGMYKLFCFCFLVSWILPLLCLFLFYDDSRCRCEKQDSDSNRRI